MKLFALAVAVFLSTAALAASVPASGRHAEKDLSDFHEWVAKLKSPAKMLGRTAVSRSFGSCRVNLCFAFDGSGSISAGSFKAQKEFSNRLGTGINFGKTGSQFSAVQYATAVTPVVPLTPSDRTFLAEVNLMRQMGGVTNIDSAIFGCSLLLNAVMDQTTHMIIMMDGNAKVVDKGIQEAQLFRNNGGVISILAEGGPNQKQLEKLTGPSGKVYRVTSFKDDLAMVAISEDIANRICT